MLKQNTEFLMAYGMVFFLTLVTLAMGQAIGAIWLGIIPLAFLILVFCITVISDCEYRTHATSGLILGVLGGMISMAFLLNISVFIPYWILIIALWVIITEVVFIITTYKPRRTDDYSLFKATLLVKILSLIAAWVIVMQILGGYFFVTSVYEGTTAFSDEIKAAIKFCAWIVIVVMLFIIWTLLNMVMKYWKELDDPVKKKVKRK